MCDSENRKSELQQIVTRLHELVDEFEQFAGNLPGLHANELETAAARLRQQLAAVIAHGLNDNDEV